MSDSLLAEQIDYYQARAAEYDEWFLRLGRYDRGPEFNAKWHSEVAEVRAALDASGPSGDVLELAPGTGLWTQRLRPHAASLTCVDASPEMLNLNRTRLQDDSIRYIQANLFEWQPDRSYNTIFFSFWLSHVPPELFEQFWATVRTALAPGGRVFFVDSRFETSSTAVNHELEGPEATTTLRKLNDGREFTIVKVFYEPAELEKRLSSLGFSAQVDGTASFFLFGSAA